MPVKVEDCTGRVKDIQKIVELITENVYVSITGMPGIGKSTIMKEVCHFIYEWNFVRDGALFLFLNECFTTDEFITKLAEALGVSQYEKNKLQVGRQTVKNKDLIIYLDNVDFII